mgnify:CR=1 FL=1
MAGNKPTKKRVTINQIAEMAGTSKTTVSFYLNGKTSRMSEETQARIRKAIHGAREYLRAKGKDIPIECEVRSLEDIDEVFAAGGVDRIMFDNFTPEMTRRAAEKVAGRCETESSGGITLSTMRDYAECGVDFISVGALTHQIKSLDMSLKACE